MTVAIPLTIREALDALSNTPDARLIQGGTDMMVEINFNHLKPNNMIALRRVQELRTWKKNIDGTVTIGAGVPYQEMETGELKQLIPALAEAARTVGSPQIRAAGTLGGNLGTCSPAGDGLPVLFALDAIVHLESSDASRDLSIHEFMLGVKRNARSSNEIITAVTVPLLDGWQGYAKVGVRNAMVISVASACLAVDTTTQSVRIALGAVGPTIIRCRDAEFWLSGQFDLSSTSGIDTAVAKEFGRRVALESKPIDDHRSTAEYRRHAVGILAQRLITRAYPS
ncbi:MAG: FAD binding domain-containing protein [Ilumatobacteraceae bacterium]|jgi:CO/xanthine dehydrogenase FAD-binding subunit